ncbi:bidirectional sugar transporter SWEET5-like [Primulina huaijiensis]|uniref:bidirectional sugar transporter SWEET5-like n=1 Tax=Primulina huaijiensis TaxID=1492673 RepID=UPI003CC6F9FB
MVDAETARTIVGVIGNVISFGLFLSPLPTFFKIWKAKSVQAFKPDPYIATVLNCAMWVFYGMPFVHPDSLLVVTINGIGFFIEIFYVTIFFIYSDWPKRKKILLALLIELVFMVVVVFITLVFLHGTKQRSMLIGILCIVFNIIMYTSPLTVMKRVIKTKSVKFMPFYLSLANFLNGMIWFSYALIKFDPYVMIPNGLGSLSGLVQLILYATYYRTTDWDDDGTGSTNQPEIQLQRTNSAAPV